MDYPPGVTEESFLDALAHCRKLLAKDFAFAYFTEEDIGSEMFFMAADALGRYDPARPLVNFLHCHLQNRLNNLRRDKFMRSDSPCRLCYAGRQAEHPGGKACRPHRDWKRLNSAKANLASPPSIDAAADDGEASLRRKSEASAAAEYGELTARIDAALDPALRADYLRLLAGERVAKPARDRVRAAVAAALAADAPAEPADPED